MQTLASPEARFEAGKGKETQCIAMISYLGEPGFQYWCY